MMGMQYRAGLGAIVGLALLAGCGLDVELTSSPGTVAIGSQVTHTVKVTNATVCPISSRRLVFYPHLTAEDEATIGTEFFGDDVTVAQLCEIEASGLPDVLARAISDPARIAAAKERHDRGTSPAQTAAASLAGAALACSPMVDSAAIDFFDCTIDPLAAGAMATLAIPVTADQLGTFRNFALGDYGDTISHVCDGGDRAGQACDVVEDCPGGNCDPGICQEGSADGLGCEVDDDCGGGVCVDCETCQIAGVCSGGPDEGSACFTEDDCDDGDEGADHLHVRHSRRLYGHQRGRSGRHRAGDVDGRLDGIDRRAIWHRCVCLAPSLAKGVSARSGCLAVPALESKGPRPGVRMSRGGRGLFHSAIQLFSPARSIGA